MSDKAQMVLVGIHGDDLLDGYERLKKERDDALTRIAELEGTRAKAMGAAKKTERASIESWNDDWNRRDTAEAERRGAMAVLRWLHATERYTIETEIQQAIERGEVLPKKK